MAEKKTKIRNKNKAAIKINNMLILLFSCFKSCSILHLIDCSGCIFLFFNKVPAFASNHGLMSWAEQPAALHPLGHLLLFLLYSVFPLSFPRACFASEAKAIYFSLHQSFLWGLRRVPLGLTSLSSICSRDKWQILIQLYQQSLNITI